VWRRVAIRAAALAGLLQLLAGCTRSAADAELREWLAETQRANTSRRSKAVASATSGWTLSVHGNIAGGEVNYDWSNLTAMANTRLTTTNPGYTANVNATLDYRGIKLSDILEASGATEVRGPGGSEVTIVAADGFIHTRPIADLKRFPIILAMEENGVPLVKNTGGPLLEIVPHTSHPETKVLYPEGGAFYVTHLIVGTEKVALSLGNKTLHAAELDAIPARTIEGKAGFRFRWPSTPVKIHGPRLSEVLAAASVVVHDGDRILVKRKPRSDTAEREVTTLLAADVTRCDVILGLRYGDARALLPAGLGGPAVLAFAPSCADATRGQSWPMFVESISIVPAGAVAEDGGR
jgi:hypothetical protein